MIVALEVTWPNAGTHPGQGSDVSLGCVVMAGDTEWLPMTEHGDKKARFDRARELFDKAWSLLPDERVAFVKKVCGDDESLADEVAKLLRAAIEPQAEGSRDGEPTQIGPYKILEPLGEGGMGVVYLAEQSKPVKRRVALKLIKLGMDSKAVVNSLRAGAAGPGADGPRRHRQGLRLRHQ